jgi:Mg2+/Co2+ transporter CorC
VFRQVDGSFVADARASLEDVTAMVGPEFEVGEAGEEVETLGGYLMTKAGRLPVRGELVPGPGAFEFEVLDADPRRLKRIRIYRRKDRRPAGPARDARPRPAEAETPQGAPPQAAPAAEPASPREDAASQRAARRP